jgi:hypothetical protein
MARARTFRIDASLHLTGAVERRLIKTCARRNFMQPTRVSWFGTTELRVRRRDCRAVAREYRLQRAAPRRRDRAGNTALSAGARARTLDRTGGSVIAVAHE